jgi:hypothetical protein
MFEVCIRSMWCLNTYRILISLFCDTLSAAKVIRHQHINFGIRLWQNELLLWAFNGAVSTVEDVERWGVNNGHEKRRIAVHYAGIRSEGLKQTTKTDSSVIHLTSETDTSPIQEFLLIHCRWRGSRMAEAGKSSCFVRMICFTFGGRHDDEGSQVSPASTWTEYHLLQSGRIVSMNSFGVIKFCCRKFLNEELHHVTSSLITTSNIK